MRKMFVIFFILGLVSILSSPGLSAGENQPPNQWNNEPSSQKLDKIMESQTEILKQLDEIKAELQVVKVRASQG